MGRISERGRKGGLAAVAAVMVSLAAAPASAGGAVIFGPKDASIYISFGGDPSETTKDAIDRCNATHKTGCRVAETFGAGCFALAMGLGGYGFSASGTYKAVQDRALAQCAQRGGKSCSIRTAQCVSD